METKATPTIFDHSAFVSGWHATPNFNGGPHAVAGEAAMVCFYWPAPPPQNMPLSTWLHRANHA